MGGHTTRSAIPINLPKTGRAEALPAGPAHEDERRHARAITALTGKVEFGIAVPAAVVGAAGGSLAGPQVARQASAWLPAMSAADNYAHFKLQQSKLGLAAGLRRPRSLSSSFDSGRHASI